MKINDYISGTKPNTYAVDPSAQSKDLKAKEQGGTAADPKSGDRVELSERSREIARARELAEGAPEVRTAKVAEIKAQIASGTYNVRSELVADAMIRSSLEEVV